MAEHERQNETFDLVDGLPNPPASLVVDSQVIAATEAASFYTIADLESILGDIGTVYKVIDGFSRYVDQKTMKDLRVAMRQTILSEPLVQSFLTPARSENEP